ncbi:MAG: zinc-binding dehydrogenase [Leptospiraceae bacterium]|nr:zinc-binding dehydrogenase [Leptospiraceae bacterium]MCP5498851.1 zinc-binding dehydrogenase [Leptospiraceae bacterium]
MKVFELTSYDAQKEHFRLREKPLPRLKEKDVLIRMSASPINPSDLMYVRGLYGIKKKLPSAPGFEGSGTIVKCGEGVSHLKEGMRVSCAAPHSGDGTWAEYMATGEENCFPLIDSFSLEEAATLFVNPLTAMAMVDMAIQENRGGIVQTAAAGALGKMIIRLAHKKGLPIINIVRKEEQRKSLEDIGAEYILNSSEPNFRRELKRLSKKLNANMAFDAVAGDMCGILIEDLPFASKILIYGALSEALVPLNAGLMIFQKKTIQGFWLSTWIYEKGIEEVLRISKEVQENLADELKTDVHKKFSLDDAYEALEYYKQNMSKGKVLIVP